MLTGENFVREVLDVDKFAYPEHLQGSFDEVYARYKVNPDTYIRLNDGESGRLAGYVCILPVQDELYYKVMAEDIFFDSGTIRAEDVLTYQKGKWYRLYVFSVALRHEFRFQGFGKMLDAGITHYIRKKVRDDGIYIASVFGTATSDEGVKFAKKAGFQVRRYLSCGYSVWEKTRNASNRWFYL
jgi:GNAT superfamily N-acetyltransferase